MLKGKSGKTQNWLPSQVVYGMDTSSPDPKNWTAFGTEVDAAAEAAAKRAAPVAAKVGQPMQSAPGAP